MRQGFRCTGKLELLWVEGRSWGQHKHKATSLKEEKDVSEKRTDYENNMTEFLVLINPVSVQTANTLPRQPRGCAMAVLRFHRQYKKTKVKHLPARTVVSPQFLHHTVVSLCE